MEDAAKLTFGQVATLVGAMLDVHADKESALQARFRLLRRLGFPAGVNVGTPGRFKYDFESTIATMVVFALMDALVMPEPAVTLVTKAWPQIVPEVRSIRDGIVFAGGEVRTSVKTEQRSLLVLRPKALVHWRLPERNMEGVGYRPNEPGVLSICKADELRPDASWEGSGPHQPTLVIDLHGIVFWTASAVLKADWWHAEDLTGRSAS